MTEPSILSMALSVASAIMGWFLRELWVMVKEMKKDLGDLEVEVSGNFVRKDELRDFRNEIIQHLIRIESKLDSKQDK
jgi:hypothetical protein